MDKKLLELFRGVFSVDSKALPDSMTPEQFGKFIEDQEGKLFIKPEDLKKIQKSLSEKDLELKKTMDLLEEKEMKGEKSEEIKELKDMVKEQGETIKSLAQESETKRLRKKFPDISPSTLLGKTEDEQERISKEQRELNEKTYGEMPSAHEPVFENSAEVDKEIERVKTDQSIDTDEKVRQVRELKEKRAEL